MSKNSESKTSKVLNIIIYIIVVIFVLGFAASAIYAIAEENSETQYSITWGGGYIEDGCSFDYSCPSSAAAGEEVTIKIYNTVKTSSNTTMYIYASADGDYTGFSDAIAFTNTNYTFTMPEYDIVITYVITSGTTL